MLRGLLLLCACVLLGAPRVRAEEPSQAPHIAWIPRLAAAREAAEAAGRPIFVALHVRPHVATPGAAARLERWVEVYRDPALIDLSRRFACVLRVVQAAEGETGAAAVTHLVVDVRSRVLARRDGERPATGAAGARQLRELLREGLRAFGPVPVSAPLIDTPGRAGAPLDLRGIAPSKPVVVPPGLPGVRLRLRWELPVPALQGAESDRIRAGVLLRWDGTGPFDLDRTLEFGSGDEVDEALDVRFDAFEGLAARAGKGTHRVDLYLQPLPGSYPFSRGPLHVGRVWIEVGDGGGAGGADGESEADPPPPEPPPLPPEPEGGAAQMPPPPPPERDEVVDPFVGDGETVTKDDAVVAVEDPDGGVKPPRQVPLEQALREFEKVIEREVRREGISARDRAFLQRYFELLRRAAQGDRR